MRFDNVWRLSTAQALAVASVGGAAASSSAFGTQTYAIQLAYPGSTSSTGGSVTVTFHRHSADVRAVRVGSLNIAELTVNACVRTLVETRALTGERGAYQLARPDNGCGEGR